MKRFSVAVWAGLLASVAAGQAAERTIKVTGAGCDYAIRFDPAKTDEKQLRNTADLLFGEGGMPMPDFPGRATGAAVTEAMVKTDREACLAPLAKARPRGDALLDMPGLKELFDRRIAQGGETCDFVAILDRALVPGASPKILLEHQASVAACGKFAAALETPAAMKALWRKQVEARCVDNASPAQCRKTAFAMESGPDGAEMIRRDLIAFDWNNCANALTPLSLAQDKDEATLEALRKAFKKQFKTKETCEEG